MVSLQVWNPQFYINGLIFGNFYSNSHKTNVIFKVIYGCNIKSWFFRKLPKKYPIEILLTLSKFQDFRIFKTLHFLEFVLILPKEKLLYRLKGLSTYHIGSIGRQTGWMFAHPRSNVIGWLVLFKKLIKIKL